jgi:hypothetical protein
MHDRRKVAALSLLLWRCADEPDTDRERLPSSEPPPVPLATELEPIAPPAACTAISERAAIALETATAEADVSCEGDADCTVIAPATSCAALCNVAVAHAGAAVIGEAITAHNDASCIAFEARGCTVRPPRCLTPRNVACLQGECTFVYAQ